MANEKGAVIWLDDEKLQAANAEQVEARRPEDGYVAGLAGIRGQYELKDGLYEVVTPSKLYVYLNIPMADQVGHFARRVANAVRSHGFEGPMSIGVKGFQGTINCYRRLKSWCAPESPGRFEVPAPPEWAEVG